MHLRQPRGFPPAKLIFVGGDLPFNAAVLLLVLCLEFVLYKVAN